MFEHGTYIALAYAATAVILTWCALAPLFRKRAVRARLAQVFSRNAEGERS